MMKLISRDQTVCFLIPLFAALCIIGLFPIAAAQTANATTDSSEGVVLSFYLHISRFYLFVRVV